MLDATRLLVDTVILPAVAEWDRTDALPDEVWDRIAEIGIPGALVPAEHGVPA